MPECHQAVTIIGLFCMEWLRCSLDDNNSTKETAMDLYLEDRLEEKLWLENFDEYDDDGWEDDGVEL